MKQKAEAQTAAATPPAALLLSRKTVLAQTEFSNSHLYELIKEGRFPRPVKFGRSVRWIPSEVSAAIAARAAQRDAK